MKILVTGGAGFIGSALIRYLIQHTNHRVINLDKLTYAGNPAALDAIAAHDNYCFEKVDICDAAEVKRVLNYHQPDAVMHLAAESHVDKSIHRAHDFIQTNIVGTYVLLAESLSYFNTLSSSKKQGFRFHHISTDEVFGDLEDNHPLFNESTCYAPNSPYSASKASSDHLVRAWHRTFGLPILITNCSNNYGPYQFPEKLIPLTIQHALLGKPIPIYGNGQQTRDWLYVDDHVIALYKVLTHGKVGETYLIGGHNEQKNIDVVRSICTLLEELRPEKPVGVRNYADLIHYVEDRPGHDKRYAICADKIKQTLGWEPVETFASGLRKTLVWYITQMMTA